MNTSTLPTEVVPPACRAMAKAGSHGSHQPPGSGMAAWLPLYSSRPIDLQETADKYIACLCIDACPEAQLTVSVRDGMLYISPVNDTPDHGNRKQGTGRFSYGFLLPANADGKRVHAYRQHGLLKVEIAKH